MPGTKFKPQYRRLLFIDRKLRDGRFPSCATLAEEWEVSAKTIQRDIDFLKWEMEAPIEYDKARHGLFYRDPSWFLPAILLSEGELLALLLGSQALRMYEGTPVAGELKGIYAKLAEKLSDPITLAPELIFSRFSFLGIPARPIQADIWKTMIRALLGRQVTRISYASPRSGTLKEHVVHPLHLANIEGDWYLLAFDTRWENVAQYAVSRIRAVDLQQETFTPPPGFDAGKMLQERFGKFVHTEGGKPTWVTIRLAAELAGPMTERTWHPRQKLRRLKDGGVELRFPVLDIRNVVPWVLSLGGGVTALAPKELRRAVQTEARALLRTCGA